MKNKIIVVYLANYKEKIYTLKRFLNYYKKYKSGVKHGLLICFKNFNENIPELKKWHKPLKKIKYLKFLDKFEIDDYDWGSYRRVAKKNKSKIILFLNSHSYPIVNNWLRIYTQNYKNNSLIGSSGSYCSLSSSFFNLKFYKDINFFKSYYYGFCNLFRFPLFPNPHIRSNAFFIKGRDFLNLNLPKLFKHKLQTNTAESGWKGMTRQLKKKLFKIIVVNKDGLAFEEKNWKSSNTFSYKGQKKLIISDNRTRIYKKSSYRKKKIETYLHWGNL